MHGDDARRASTDDGTVVDRPPIAVSRTQSKPPQPDDDTDDDAAALEVRGSGSPIQSQTGAEPSKLDSAVVSPVEAMHLSEVLRTRTFCRVTMAVGAVGAVAVPFLPGHPVAQYIFMSGIGLAIIALGYLHHRTSDPATFHDGWGVSIGWYVPALTVCSAVPFFGPFSPVPILLVLGLYVTSAGASFPLALAIYLTCAITQAVSAALVIAGITDPGLIPAEHLPLHVQIIGQILVEVVILATFLISRAARRSSLTALSELERAVRAVAQREALLEEAREELRRAVGSGRGRFTDQVIGHFKLGDLIGRGAMGEVYEAIDTTTNQPVAMKLLSQTSLGNAHHVQRFLRELQTASQIDSPNVVRVLEVGEQPLPHLVMERLRGRDLSTILRGKRAMRHDKVVDLVRQVGAGITAAGAAGIIHRDLKPQNLFRSGAIWKILDFGVSRLADTGDTLTAGHVVGTPAYMAPEQARGGDVDHRSDLYSLAAIAYRTLTGHAPFSGDKIADTLYRVVHTPPRRPTSLAVLPDDVDDVLAIGLAKDPDHRFATAGEFADALAAALAGELDESIRARGHALTGAWGIQVTRAR
jgi:serine/threonine-protein kinase